MHATTTSELRRAYHRARSTYPLLPASSALAIARGATTDHGWEHERGDTYTKEREGFTLTMVAQAESHYPEDGETYGHYVQEDTRGYGEWQGNYPEPREELPLGLPYTAFRWTGAMQGEGGYFIPSEVEEQYDYYRRSGQSRSVAWDMTRAWVEQQLSDLFGSPLTYYGVTVIASRAGIDLGTAAMGTDVFDTDTSYLFDVACDLEDEAIEQANDALKQLCDVAYSSQQQGS